MKYIVIVPDGAADYPCEELKGKTPLEVADKPAINSLAAEGIVGRVKTIPRGFAPASDVANLALLGYEPQKYYTGRGPLEAANLGVELSENDIAFRCNLITESEGNILDYSAGHISDGEAKALIGYIGKNLSTPDIEFYPGTSYRHLMVYRKVAGWGLDKLRYFPPHDIMGKEIKKHLPRGKNSQLVNDLMLRSQAILKDHEINKVRIDLGENPANMIWLWGCGAQPDLPAFKEKFGLEGGVISAVDLIKGIGRLVGLKVAEVKGANGYYDTNYEGKAKAALKILEDSDFVFVHIEATDEAGHNKDLLMKIACIERIDKMIVAKIVKELKGKDFRVLITPDHPTPVALRTHTDEPVPFLICGTGIKPAGFLNYCEAQAMDSDLYFSSGPELLKFFLKK